MKQQSDSNQNDPIELSDAELEGIHGGGLGDTWFAAQMAAAAANQTNNANQPLGGWAQAAAVYA